MSKKQMIPSQKAKNSWLCGKTKCGECGYALIAKRFDKRQVADTLIKVIYAAEKKITIQWRI